MGTPTTVLSHLHHHLQGIPVITELWQFLRIMLGKQLFSVKMILQPSLIDFETFDYNTGTLVLIFSESVNVNSFNFSAVILRSSFTDLPSTNVTLSPSNSSNFDSESITITLSNEVLNSIKASTDLCISTITCSLQFSQEFVSDRAGNSIIEVTSFGSFIMSEHPTNLIGDTTPPSLISFKPQHEQSTDYIQL